jgi:hypothetical protein
MGEKSERQQNPQKRPTIARAGDGNKELNPKLFDLRTGHSNLVGYDADFAWLAG